MADLSTAPTVRVTVRYFAAARAAVGLDEETLVVLADGRTGEKGNPSTTVGSVVLELVARHGSTLDRVLTRCSYLLDEAAVHGPQTSVRPGQVLDVLPPFAGG